MNSNRLAFLLTVLTVIVPVVRAQDSVVSSTTQRDQQATAVAASTLKVLTGVGSIADITLQGTLHRIAGSDRQSGTFVLQAAGYEKSRAFFLLDGGQREKVRNGLYGYQTDQQGLPRRLATHHCFMLGHWFYPGLSLQSLYQDPQLSIIYAGLEKRAGTPVHHLRLFRTISDQPAEMVAITQRLSSLDLYVDGDTYLPVALRFMTHPDDDMNQDLAVDVRFSDYRVVNGVQIPFHIQRFLQGSLLLDITVGSASVNTGIADSTFAVQIE